jgi:predicted acylesterase/phospholipase RssA
MVIFGIAIGLGYYHIGVLKTLFEAKCLPVVISGASAGSLIAALICTRTDEVPVLWPSIHHSLFQTPFCAT